MPATVAALAASCVREGCFPRCALPSLEHSPCSHPVAAFSPSPATAAAPLPGAVERVDAKGSHLAGGSQLAMQQEHRWGAPYPTQISLLFRRSLRTRRFEVGEAVGLLMGGRQGCQVAVTASPTAALPRAGHLRPALPWP